jgi:FHA domain
MDAALNGPSGRTALGPAVLTIGRAQTNGLVVNDVKASSRHAEISPSGAGYSITDVGSTNGTFVNEKQLDRNVPRMLNASDRVRIGDTVFTYEGPGAFSQDATVYAGEGSSPEYQPTVAAPPPYTNYDQGYVPPQQGAWGSSNPAWAAGSQQFPPQQQGYPPPPAAYPSYTPPVQPAYGAPATTTAPRTNRNLLIGLVAGGIVVLALLIVLFTVVLPSTPTKALDAFCNGLKAKDYQTAYNQLSTRQQGLGSESMFATDFSSITNCTHGSPTESGNTASTSLTLFGTISGRPGSATGTVTLIKENGNWKIDNVSNLVPTGQ